MKSQGFVSSLTARLASIAATAVAVLLASAVLASAAGYTITDLGTLPGYVGSSALGINSAGQAVGYSYDASGNQHAVLFSNGSVADLGTFGGQLSAATSINSSGQTVGYATDASGNQHAVLFSSGKVSDLGTMPGYVGGGALGINDSGQAVGYAYDARYKQHAVLFSSGKVTDLGSFGGQLSMANSINNSGQVVRDAYDVSSTLHAHLLSNGTITDLGTLPGYVGSRAQSINSTGQAVGMVMVASGFQHAALFSNGTVTDLGTLGGQYSYACSINNTGQAVGYAFDAMGAQHAALFSNGTVTDLGTRVNAVLGWHLNKANAINDSGQIVGEGVINGQMHAFLLTPSDQSVPPVANAGNNQTVQMWFKAILDGSGSTDPSGNVPLTYSWSFVSVPAGSTAVLANPTNIHPNFTPDQQGNYVVQLIVTNSVGVASSPATVTITVVINSGDLPPVAYTGPNMSVLLGTTVQLNGSASDPNGLPIVAWIWVVEGAPAGAPNPLSATNIPTPLFTGTVLGQYNLGLYVYDGQLWSNEAFTVIKVLQNQPPVAVINSTPPSGTVPLTVQFDATSSYDPEGGILQYSWDFGDGTTNIGVNPTHTYTSTGTYVATLMVIDPLGAIDKASIVITVLQPILPPIASPTATPNSGPAPLTVQFASNATDPQNLPLTYSWAFGDGGTSTAVNPSYSYIQPGTYIAWLTVSNGLAQGSNSLLITISLTPQPIANAGSSKTVHEGSLVTLDASGSSDPSGDVPLTYSWSFVSVPAGSTAVLANPTNIHPTFTADQQGNYVVQLIVTNNVGVVSTPATVTISTLNSPPLADPGLGQAITQIGTTVHLDGSKSYDPDGDPITYSWSFVSVPTGSKPVLTGSNTATPTFVADVHGTYVVQLVVSDPWVPSAPKTVTVSFNNIAPVADAGAGQAAVVGDIVTLNGSGSSDANLDPLTYQWSFVSVPPGSIATLTNPTSVQSTFIPNIPGIYVVQLIVNDGFVNSAPSSVQIKVVSVLDDALTDVKKLVAMIGSLDKKDFRNPCLRNELINKLHDVMTDLEKRNHGDALQDLQNDILKRVDGCSQSGAPDRDDWIIACPDQISVYQQLITIISEVKELMHK